MTAFEQERTKIRKKIWSFLPIQKGEKVLDVGVGRTAHSLTKLIELGATVTSIDLDWQALHKHKTSEANSVQCNAAQIPFRNTAFELSLANFTFHEIGPALHHTVFSELCRVSKRIMIVEPATGEDPIYRVFQDIWTESMHSINQFEDYGTMDYWADLLKNCGAQVTITESLSSDVRLYGQEAKDYMKTAVNDLREDGVSEKYVKKMLAITGDIESKGITFSDINVIVALCSIRT